MKKSASQGDKDTINALKRLDEIEGKTTTTLLPSIPTPLSVPIVINQNQPTQNLTDAKGVVLSTTATVNVK